MRWTISPLPTHPVLFTEEFEWKVFERAEFGEGRCVIFQYEAISPGEPAPAELQVDADEFDEELVDGGPARKLLLLNGVVYWLNNQMNFLVLEKVDAVTHGLINCGRRVANIAFAIVWFGVSVTLYNGIGMSLALIGTFSYMRAKRQISGPAKPASKQFSPMPAKRAL